MKTGHLIITDAALKYTIPITARPSTKSLVVKAHPDNIGNVWIFGANDTDGMPLSVSEGILLEGPHTNTWKYGADSGNNGDTICYLIY